MASSLLVLLDDIATTLDDIAVLTKVAAKKTAGVLGDDLALNAKQVSGVSADRELPVVWAVAKGSAVNKFILVPLALLLSQFLPQLITPLLVCGGLFLCYEGFEKVAHSWLPSSQSDKDEHKKELQAYLDPTIDWVAYERDQIKGAIRTDFVLSAEIIVITLGTITGQPFEKQLAVLVAVSILMTIGVYGLVAGIVKMDDLGLFWSKSVNTIFQRLGQFLLFLAPKIMKTLTILGTLAMFLVGGGIVSHAIPAIGHMSIAEWMKPILDGGIGFVSGGVVVAIMLSIQKLRSGMTKTS